MHLPRVGQRRRKCFVLAQSLRLFEGSRSQRIVRNVSVLAKRSMVLVSRTDGYCSRVHSTIHSIGDV